MKQNQLALYYLYRFSFDFILVYPLYVLIFQNRGLHEGAIAWLLALWSFFVVVLELPAGVLSDRLPRKHLLVAAALTKALGFLIWIPAQSFFLFSVGFFFWALSEALVSGTEEAWLYETLVEAGRKNDYQKIKGRGAFFASMAIAASALIGGYAARHGETAVLVLSGISGVVSACSAFFFGKPPHTDFQGEESFERCVHGESGLPCHNDQAGQSCQPVIETDGHSVGGILYMLRSAWMDLARAPGLAVLVLLSSTVLLVPGVLEEWDPVALTSVGGTPLLLGVWLSLRYGLESFGSLLAHRFDRQLGFVRPLLVVATATGVLVFVFGVFRSLYLLPLYGLFYAVYAVLAVQADAQIQHIIDGRRRATVLSVRSMLSNISGIAMILAIGYGAENVGWPVVWTTSAVFIAVLCLLFALISLTGKKDGRKINTFKT